MIRKTERSKNKKKAIYSSEILGGIREQIGKKEAKEKGKKMGRRDEREEEDRGGLVACNLRPLKTSWETARLLCLNGTGDGMRRTGRNVEGSREDGRETYALPPAQGGGSCFATAARNLEPAWWGWLSEFELLENVSGTPCSKIG